MIGTTKKPLEEVLEVLAPYRKVAVVGCDGCAKVCATGGVEEVADLAKTLKEQGKDIVFEATPERTCNVAKSDPVLKPLVDKMQEAEALIVLGCGGAVQITRHLTETYGLSVPVKVGLNSVGHMDTLVPGQVALEECSDCGECILNETGGICPVTRCAKSLMNGPCGGPKNGLCEINLAREFNPEVPCAWLQIYDRLASLGQLERLFELAKPKDWSQGEASGPRRVLRPDQRP
jgi:ferredoxin